MSRSVFVDTSALYAVLDADDDMHTEGAAAWLQLLEGVESGEFEAITHNAVLVETSALVQRRLGMRALADLFDLLLPVLRVRWIDEPLQARAVSAMLAAGRTDISLVDWTSFELMRMDVVEDVLAFDDDFVRQGFTEFR